MSVFRLHGCVRIRRPRVTDVEFLGHRVSVVRIHKPASAAGSELSRRLRNAWHGVGAIAPRLGTIRGGVWTGWWGWDTTQRPPRAWNDLLGAVETKHLRKYGWVRHLFHE